MIKFMAGAIGGGILSALAVLIFVAPFRQQTYIESNPVEHLIWLRSSGDSIPFIEMYGSSLSRVCVFGNVDTTVSTLLFMNGIEVTTVLRGSLEESEHEKLGGLFRVVLIDTTGQGEIWKFDERRFHVSLDGQEEEFGCVRARSVSLQLDRAVGGRYILEVKAMDKG